MKFQRFLTGVAAASLLTIASSASAATALVSDGVFSAGIGESGALFDGSTGLSNGAYDSVGQGIARDSWGLNGYQVDPNFFGVVDGSTTVTGGGATATALTNFGDFTVEQTYSFLDGVLLVDVLVTNLGVEAPLYFQRGVDWDLDDNGEETVSAGGSKAWIFDTTHFGFDDATGFGPYYAGCPGSCDDSASDRGAGIRLNLGTLASGATRKFTYYYAMNGAGEGADSVTARTAGAGAKYVITGVNSDGSKSATFGVSVAPVPEPATWAMMLLGFFSLGAMIRRRRAVMA